MIELKLVRRARWLIELGSWIT